MESLQDKGSFRIRRYVIQGEEKKRGERGKPTTR